MPHSLVSMLFNRILKLRIAYRRVLMEKLKQNGYDLSFEYFQVLFRVSAEPGISQHVLADITGRDKASLTCLLNKMENQKLVFRKIDEKDARSNLVFLSPDGEKIADGIRVIVGEIYRQVEEKVGKQNALDAISFLDDVYAEFGKI